MTVWVVEYPMHAQPTTTAYPAHNENVYFPGDVVTLGADGYLQKATVGDRILGVISYIDKRPPITPGWRAEYQRELGRQLGIISTL